MKRICIFLTLIFVLTCSLQAQKTDATNSIKRANEMYKQGQYSDAAALYEEILKNGVSPELYYNLGNSYYKADETGLAILNYERALRLDPGLNDASYNLDIAQQKVVDNINSSPSFFVKRWINSLIESYTTNQWAIISVVAFIAMLVLFFLFAFSSTRSKRKYAFYASFFAGFLFVLSLSFSGIRKDELLKHHDAIVLSGAVTAKSSPDKSGTDIFQLHEGTRVTVKNLLGNWVEIKLENGAVGWIEESNIERI